MEQVVSEQGKEKMYKLAIVIGRHQIVHAGHELLKTEALKIADHVLILIGSAHQARTPKNPFTWEERKSMIMLTLSKEEQRRVTILPVRDYYNDSAWTDYVKALIREHTNERAVSALVGHQKSHCSDTYYLDNFSDCCNYFNVKSELDIDASMLRAMYFEASNIDASLAAMGDNVSNSVKQFLQAWSLRPEYAMLRDEHKQLKTEAALWNNTPYPVIFVTADAIVKAKDRILLGIRKSSPGAGVLAIPGGFVEQHETVYNAAVRELREETNIGILPEMLNDTLIESRVFDYPKRSCRGRVITHAFFFDLHVNTLPSINAGDDLQYVEWVPINDLPKLESKFHDDHFHILNSFLNLMIG